MIGTIAALYIVVFRSCPVGVRNSGLVWNRYQSLHSFFIRSRSRLTWTKSGALLLSVRLYCNLRQHYDAAEVPHRLSLISVGVSAHTLMPIAGLTCQGSWTFAARVSAQTLTTPCIKRRAPGNDSNVCFLFWGPAFARFGIAGVFSAISGCCFRCF